MTGLERELEALGYSEIKVRALAVHVAQGRVAAFEAILRGSARLSRLAGQSRRGEREDRLADGARAAARLLGDR